MDTGNRATANEAPRPHRERIAFFDTLRGFTIISMVCFHAAYDAAVLYGYELPWFSNPLIQNLWRCSISWTFLMLAGWMTSFSRNNLKRGGIYALCALLVFIATSVAGVDTAVSFGILFCMAASTFIAAALRPLIARIHAVAGLIACLALFVSTYALPHARYAVEDLAWLGLPSYTFSSGDYYPLIPYTFLYLAGVFAARAFLERHRSGYPRWLVEADIAPLSQIGKASLVIYLVHQPLLLTIIGMIARA